MLPKAMLPKHLADQSPTLPTDLVDVELDTSDADTVVFDMDISVSDTELVAPVIPPVRRVTPDREISEQPTISGHRRQSSVVSVGSDDSESHVVPSVPLVDDNS